MRLASRSWIALACLAAASWTAPAVADQPLLNVAVAAFPHAEPGPPPNVFGTVALPVRATPTSTRWAKVMQASLDQPALDHLTAQARTMSPEDEVAFVQHAVNSALVNGASSTNCSDDGYWAPASETLARHMGDCFDVAVAKMEALRLLGVPAKDLYLTTGWFRQPGYPGKGRESVALLVHINDHYWLMPEQSDHAIESGGPGEAGAGFTPAVTYGVGVTWIHGRVVHAAPPAPASGPSSAVATGAGAATAASK